MSDPVTHEIDLDEVEREAIRDRDEYPFNESRQSYRNAQLRLSLVARLRAAEARAEAAEAERDLLAAQAPSLIAERAHYKAEVDALRARVPTEDEIEALEVAAEELDNKLSPRLGLRER